MTTEEEQHTNAVVATTPTASAVSVTDIQTLSASSVDASKLLAILHELKTSVGPKVVNNAIAKIMSSPDTPTISAVNDSNTSSKSDQQLTKKQKKKKNGKQQSGREFNMRNYQSRRITVKFLYSGENYAGFARQDHMEETVERYLFDALIRTKLIDDIENCGYSRCGRTDKGVSAFGQVIGVTVRSNLPVDAELLDVQCIDDVRAGAKFRIKLASGQIKTITEVDYPTHINRALPEAIRVYSVVPSPTPDFSARFDCQARLYRYFFMKKDLDIEKMRQAAKDLIGKHDFRNFCRIDPNCHTYERAIQSFEIVACDGQQAKAPAHQMYRFEILGRAFLWHQVRCMVQILFMIGSGREEPDIIKKLLDIDQTPRKPQYEMASDLPLVLHDCLFKNISFNYSPLALYQVHHQLSTAWEQQAIKTAMLRSHLDMLESFPVDSQRVIEELDHYAPKLEQLLTERNLHGTAEWRDVWPLLPLASRRKVIPLFTRDTGHSVDEKKQKVKRKQQHKRQRLEYGAAQVESLVNQEEENSGDAP